MAVADGDAFIEYGHLGIDARAQLNDALLLGGIVAGECLYPAYAFADAAVGVFVLLLEGRGGSEDIAARGGLRRAHLGDQLLGAVDDLQGMREPLLGIKQRSQGLRRQPGVQQNNDDGTEQRWTVPTFFPHANSPVRR